MGFLISVAVLRSVYLAVGRSDEPPPAIPPAPLAPRLSPPTCVVRPRARGYASPVFLFRRHRPWRSRRRGHVTPGV
jgi:hypothetical protein